MSNIKTLPFIQEIINELISIHAEYITFELSPEDQEEGLDIRLQINRDGSYTLHSGNAQYDNDHRGYWGTGSMQITMIGQDFIDLANELISEALDQLIEDVLSSTLSNTTGAPIQIDAINTGRSLVNAILEPINASGNGSISWYEDWCPSESETAPAGVLIAYSWNAFPDWLYTLAEKVGFGLGNSDEYSDCEGCNRVFRTIADDMHWRPAFFWSSECFLTCRDCAKNDPDAYLKALYTVNGNEGHEVFSCIDPAEHGYIIVWESEYEYRGQKDAQEYIRSNKLNAYLITHQEEHRPQSAEAQEWNRKYYIPSQWQVWVPNFCELCQEGYPIFASHVHDTFDNKQVKVCEDCFNNGDFKEDLLINGGMRIKG